MADIARYVGEVVTAIRGGAGIARRARHARPAAAAAPPRPTGRRHPTAGPQASRSRTPAKPARRCLPALQAGSSSPASAAGAASRWREGCRRDRFELAGKRITQTQVGELVKKGKTRRRKWRTRNGAEINGRLVLDLAAAREAGAARLETG